MHSRIHASETEIPGAKAPALTFKERNEGMDQYETKERVFEAYMREELNRLDAIEVLQDQFNMSSHEAEALVEAWDS